MFCDSKSERAELNAAPKISQDTNRIKDSWEAPAVPLSNVPEHSVIYPLLNGIFLATPKKDCVGIHTFPSYCAPPFLSAAHVKAPPVYRLLKSSIQPHWWPPSTCRALYCPSSHAPSSSRTDLPHSSCIFFSQNLVTFGTKRFLCPSPMHVLQ